jgi:LuxR family maltose regulon positive regulatory protein
LLCASGPEAMRDDAEFALAQERVGSPWRDGALWELAEAQLLLGDVDEARTRFAEASTYAATMGNTDSANICEAHLALLAMERGHWDTAAEHVKVALTTIDQHRMHDYLPSLLAFAAAARLALHDGDIGQARSLLTQAMRGRPTATFAVPYLSVRLRVQLARVYLAMSEVKPARHLLREIDDILLHRPGLGRLIEEVDVLRARAADATVDATSVTPLTAAELRLLPYLQTHLSFQQIGQRLFVSRNTVASQVHSIYRKLGVSSRDDAVQHATAIGLLGA